MDSIRLSSQAIPDQIPNVLMSAPMNPVNQSNAGFSRVLAVALAGLAALLLGTILLAAVQITGQQYETALALVAAAGLLLLIFLALVVVYLRRVPAEVTQTVRRELEQENSTELNRLRREIIRLKAMLDGMNAGVIYTENNQIRYANLTMTQMIGYDNGVSDDDTTHRLAGLYQSLASLIGRNGNSQGVFTILRRDGSEFDARVIHRHLDELGGVVTMIYDNTAEKHLQTQKSQFMSNAAHGLRTPIANIKTRLYLLRRQPEKLQEHVTILEEVVEKLRGLLEEMFDLSQFERGAALLERQDIVLQDLVSQVVSNYQDRAQARSITLNCELPPEPLTVFVDLKRFSQVINTLVSNALSHTREQSVIEVRVMRDSANPHQWAVIQVQDNGIGIAQDLLTRVFQPFSLAKHGGEVGGTALGLSISKEIVELHEGEITAESEAGKRTIFTIRLPLLAA
ncbi:MAG TPA: HAMP domain-containing sensor histidine kinase [Phototrophicaceae bacterium]|nr:HAMP domain-containing sensor histidine kinase [Phototrophicaceae bacterium]